MYFALFYLRMHVFLSKGKINGHILLFHYVHTLLPFLPTLMIQIQIRDSEAEPLDDVYLLEVPLRI